MTDEIQTSAKKMQPWRGHLLIMPTFKPGDLPPEGYLQWHEWADVQRKAGIEQVECPTCSLWRTPQELSTYCITRTGKDRRGRDHTFSQFQCAKCFAKTGEIANVKCA
jgi:hypothetical protein